MFYTHLLELSNNEYYAGSTKDLSERVRKHQSGEVPHTSKFRPVKLVWYSAFDTMELARKFEKYLKSSPGKAFRNKHLI
ncbi:MAG: GIY-YIG nuclease family protein [Patescibacteria group bacterium]